MTKMSKNDWNKNDFDSMSRDQLLVLWNNLTSTLETVKKNEMELRKYIVAREFPNKKEGINSVQLGNNYVLKTTIKFNYRLDDNKKVEEGLDKIALIGNQGKFIAERLISWKPNLVLKEFRDLQKEVDEGSLEAKEILKIVNSFLTISDATPILTISEPK